MKQIYIHSLIAYLVFKEAVGKRIWLAAASITTASITLSWNTGGGWGFSLGAAGVLGACILWGMDNNFTRNISAKDPLVIVTIKGLAAGSFSLILALLLHNNLPNYKIMLLAMLLGCLSYGLSIILFILAMRNLGAARTSALFGTAPFAGVLVAAPSKFKSNEAVEAGVLRKLNIRTIGAKTPPAKIEPISQGISVEIILASTSTQLNHISRKPLNNNKPRPLPR